MIKTQFFSRQNQMDTFSFIASGDAMELFQGSFLVPGIAETRVVTGSKKIIVQDSWGFINQEQIVSSNPPESLAFRIKPNPLLALWIKSIHENWQIKSVPLGSMVERTFSLQPRAYAGVFLSFFERILKTAIEKNNERLSFYLLFEKRNIRKPLLPPAQDV